MNDERRPRRTGNFVYRSSFLVHRSSFIVPEPRGNRELRPPFLVHRSSFIVHRFFVHRFFVPVHRSHKSHRSHRSHSSHSSHPFVTVRSPTLGPNFRLTANDDDGPRCSPSGPALLNPLRVRG